MKVLLFAEQYYREIHFICFTVKAFHYNSTNHDNHYISEFNDSGICYRIAKLNHNKKWIIKIGSVVFKIPVFAILATISWLSLPTFTNSQILAYNQGIKLNEVLIPPFLLVQNPKMKPIFSYKQ